MKYSSGADGSALKLHNGVGFSYYLDGIPGKAISEFNNAINISRKNENSSYLPWIYKGAALQYEDRNEEAIKAYDVAIKAYNETELKNSDYFTRRSVAYAWNGKGVAQVKLGMVGESIWSFRKACEIDNNFSDAYTNLGLMLLQLKNYNESILSFSRAIANLKDNGDAQNDWHWKAWYGEANAFASMEDYQAATKCYDNATLFYRYNEFFSSDKSEVVERAGIFVDKGTALHDSGLYVEALSSFNEALTLLEPKKGISTQAESLYSQMLYKKADTLYKLGCYNDSLTAYDLANGDKRSNLLKPALFIFILIYM